MTERSRSLVPLPLLLAVASLLSACGGGASAPPAETTSETSAAPSGGGETEEDTDEFVLSDSEDAELAHGEHPSEITSTPTHAAMRLFVVDPETGPIAGVVVKLTGPDGRAYYTYETDALGYAEVLVPAGARYDLEYLSLGRRSAEAHVDVPEGPNQDIRLTLRYRRRRTEPPPPTAAAPEPERLVLDGVLFETGSATLEAESGPRLDRVVEYMTHRPSVRVRIAGHTDDVGDPRRNQTLSEDRAEAVRDYLVAHGIDASRIEAVGFGDTQPVDTNDTEEGRARNRRIEATEL